MGNSRRRWGDRKGEAGEVIQERKVGKARHKRVTGETVCGKG